MGNKHNCQPLLYIEQPCLLLPHAKMQEQFHNLITKDRGTFKEKGDVPFKKLKIEEQIEYLLSSSEGIPNIRCELITTRGKFRGIIVNQNETEIIFQMAGRTKELIEKQAIQKIHLIGF